MLADEAGRVAIKRRSDAVPGWAVLPLELGVQVGPAQPPLQLSAAAVAESMIQRVKVVAEPNRLAGPIGRGSKVLGSHIGPDDAPVGARRCRPQWWQNAATASRRRSFSTCRPGAPRAGTSPICSAIAASSARLSMDQVAVYLRRTRPSSSTHVSSPRGGGEPSFGGALP